MDTNNCHGTVIFVASNSQNGQFGHGRDAWCSRHYNDPTRLAQGHDDAYGTSAGTGLVSRNATNAIVPDLEWDVSGSNAHGQWREFASVIRQHVMQEEIDTGNFVQFLYSQEFIFDLERFYKNDGEAASGEARRED